MLVRETINAIENFRPAYSSILLGMSHWSVLEREEALEALSNRKKSIEDELIRLNNIQINQQPLPDFIEALFDFSFCQLQEEEKWGQSHV